MDQKPSNPEAVAEYLATDLRQFMLEQMDPASAYFSIAQQFCALGDDAGLEYALRKFRAHEKLIFGGFNDLQATKAAHK